jgi:GWxTD domain-containing protein
VGARLFVLLAALGAALPGSAAAQPEDRGELPWRIAGPVGFTVDAATSPEGETGHLLRLFVRIPPSTLRGLVRDPDGGARLSIRTQIKTADGPLEWRQDIEVGQDQYIEGLGKVATMHFPVRPGPVRLQLRIEDLVSRKRGLIYLGREVHESAEITGVIQIASARNGRDMSDIEFVWSERPGTLMPTGQTRPAYVPNAERLYGLLEPTLRAAFSARVAEADERPWRWVTRVYDRENRVLAEVDSTGPPGAQLDAAVSIGLEGLPAGRYDLEIKTWQQGDEGALVRRAPFSIGWRKETWFLNPSEIEDNVHLLLATGDDEEAFVLMHPGEQERFLDDFWEKRDPDPERPGNRARETYLRRIDYANETYSRMGIEKGMFSDRGRVFVRYGQPSEILQQVIPAGDETLRQMIQQLAYEEDRSPKHVQQRGLGGDMRPFEVWIYTGEIPLPPDADPDAAGPGRRRRLVFLFVDDQGLGNYSLRYSTE